MKELMSDLVIWLKAVLLVVLFPAWFPLWCLLHGTIALFESVSYAKVKVQPYEPRS